MTSHVDRKDRCIPHWPVKFANAVRKWLHSIGPENRQLLTSFFMNVGGAKEDSMFLMKLRMGFERVELVEQDPFLASEKNFYLDRCGWVKVTFGKA